MGACLALGSLASCVSKRLIIKVLSPVCVIIVFNFLRVLSSCCQSQDFTMTTRIHGAFCWYVIRSKVAKNQTESGLTFRFCCVFISSCHFYHVLNNISMRWWACVAVRKLRGEIIFECPIRWRIFFDVSFMSHVVVMSVIIVWTKIKKNPPIKWIPWFTCRLFKHSFPNFRV